MVDKRYMGEEKEKNYVLRNIAKTGSLIGEGVMEYRDFSMIGKSVSQLSSNVAVTGSVALSKDNYKHSTVSDAGAFMQSKFNGLGKTAYVSRKLRGGFDGYIQEKMYKKLENYIRRNIKKKQILNKRLSQKNMEFTTRYYNEFHKRNMWGFNKFEYEATQLFRQNKILEKLQKLSSIKNNGGDKILKALIQYYNQNKGIFNSPADYINDFIKQLENGKYAHKVKFLGDTQRNVFQKQMIQTLEWYRDIKKIFEENKGTILPHAKAIETAYAYEFIKDAINQTNTLMTYLKKTGFNYTTLKDAEKFDIATKRRYGLIINDIDEKGNEKSIDVTAKLRNFLNNNKYNNDLNILLDKKGISFDFENIILDSNLYTYAKTGEMIENRYLKAGDISAIDSFQERVEAPLFITDSTNLTSWQAFYSSLSKEELQVLDSGQVHKFASNLGDKGFDSVTKTNQEEDIRNPLNNNGHFYTSGNVFRYTESGVGDLIETPLQFGAFSRMAKSYARSGYNEEVTDRDASQVYEDNSVGKFVRRTLKYINPSKGFISLNEAAVDKSLSTLMEFMIPTFDDDVVRIPAIEKLRRSFHQFDLRALDNEIGVFTPDVVKKYAKNKGILSELDIKNIKGLETLNEFLGCDNIHTIDARPRDARVFLEDVINNDKDKVSFISTKLVSDSGISKVGKANVSEININDLKSSGAIDDECDLTFNTKINTIDAVSPLVGQGLAVSKERLAGSHINGDTLANGKKSTQVIDDISRIDELSDFLKGKFYSASKLDDIFGFLMKTGVGCEDYGRGETLVSSILRTSPHQDFLVGNHRSILSGIGRRYVSRGPNKVYSSRILNKMFDGLPSIGESPDSSLNNQIQKDGIKLFDKAHETPDKYHLDGTGSDEITRLIYDNQDTYHWNNKKFSNVETREKNGTVPKSIDTHSFMVQEFDTSVKLTQEDNQGVIDWIAQYFKVGEKDKIGFTRDFIARMNNTYASIDAIVYTNRNKDGRFSFETNKDQSFNALLGKRIWKKRLQINDDGSSTSPKTFNLNASVADGKYFEMVTHDILPKIPFVGKIADMFLQKRTSIESYKRDQVYDSDWRLWPQLYEGNTVVSQNQIITGEEMTNMGARRITSGLNNVFVPQVREGEREINQYFDIYEKFSKSLQSKESASLEAFFDDADGKERKNKGLKGYSTDKKKTLSWAEKMGYGDTEAVKSQINELFDGLEDISSTKETNQAGKYMPLAIKYRQEYEGIFYSMSETEDSDSTSLMGALTPKGKKYIPRFFETNSSKEGQEILRYVPENTKGILQDSWALRVDKQEGIEDYFNTHYLPTENWTGWNASTNLDGIKIKVMQKKGGNPTISGDWSKDQTRAEKTGEKVIPIHSLSSLINIGRLRDVLLGMGLSDVDVQLTTSYGEGPGGINTSIDIMKDVKNEILDGLNAGVHSSLF
ncbi:hypothetical protein COF09_23905 [Bacillus toyonensis]|uniref:hypothetical protein n=1 Tax=Bacillus toyonensis TaxID=155322 RepID=UPI000BFD0BFA|nr:hypothetical protein [Bacillus toyonensis]PHC38630.1 hypothetical protein COF09_23905 [Bacillus toyonensis]